jgi:hypothetical protein
MNEAARLMKKHTMPLIHGNANDVADSHSKKLELPKTTTKIIIHLRGLAPTGSLASPENGA